MDDEPAAPPAAERAQPSRVDEAIERWFVDHIHNSPVSRNTEGVNHLRQALEKLKQTLNAL